MYIQYTGFKVDMDSRIYSFQVLDALRDPRQFTVRIQSDTNHWAALKLQDGPGICFERLERELGLETSASSAELSLRISEKDIREYLARHSPSGKAFERTSLPERYEQHRNAPAMAPPPPAVRGFPEPGSVSPKEAIIAVLLHRAGDTMDLLKLALESQSIQIRCLTTVQDTRPWLQAVNPPHLVFTEAMLPDGAWADVVREALGARKPVNVIVVSRLVDVSLYVDTMAGGAFDFIVPPLSVNELKHVVKCAVENVLNLRRARPATP